MEKKQLYSAVGAFCRQRSVIDKARKRGAAFCILNSSHATFEKSCIFLSWAPYALQDLMDSISNQDIHNLFKKKRSECMNEEKHCNLFISVRQLMSSRQCWGQRLRNRAELFSPPPTPRPPLQSGSPLNKHINCKQCLKFVITLLQCTENTRNSLQPGQLVSKELLEMFL